MEDVLESTNTVLSYVKNVFLCSLRLCCFLPALCSFTKHVSYTPWVSQWDLLSPSSQAYYHTAFGAPLAYVAELQTILSFLSCVSYSRYSPSLGMVCYEFPTNRTVCILMNGGLRTKQETTETELDEMTSYRGPYTCDINGHVTA